MFYMQEENIGVRSKEKILLIEDIQETLTNSQALLEASYEIELVSSEQEAIKVLGQESYDLILLNINQAEFNKSEVIKFINDAEIDIYVIVMSTVADLTTVRRAFHAGAGDFIKMPYEVEDLHDAIRQALDTREQEKSLASLRKKLERSEKLHRFMIESSPDMIFIVDKNGFFAFVNDRAEEILGYRKDELLDEYFTSIVDPQYYDKAEHCFREKREGARAMENIGIWLNCKKGTHLELGKNKIAIELTSLGVYEYDESASEHKQFSGTYVVARDITERLEAEKLIHYQAYHDLLTGLPNRVLFMDRLENAIRRARREKEGLAIMFFDLDRFKIVNDSLGHSVGDELLKQVSRRLKIALRESDTLARFGGDEFIVLLSDITSAEVAQKIGEKVHSAVNEPFQIDDQEIFITASIGISLYPQDGEDAEALIKNSDTAMYHTKERGKNAYSFYERDMSIKHHRFLNIENDIHHGIEEEQFEVYYQPLINLENGEVIGLEALLRWNHPEKGLLFPAFFLSVAEEAGLMIELGDWAVNTALSEVQSWRESGFEMGKLAINFSNKQFGQRDFVDKIMQALNAHNFPPSALEVEVTETVLISDMGSSIIKLGELNDAGVRAIIDDFGTGYSSLSLLQKLPISRVKVDRSLIQQMDNVSGRSIIEAIAHMVKGLGFEMSAEGIEEGYQLDYLKQLECSDVQGFFFSKALPAEKAKAFIKKNRRSYGFKTAKKK